MVSSNAQYLALEFLVRIILFATFLISEYLTPFKRIIQPEEWWLYKNPVARPDLINANQMFCISILTPIITIFFMSLCRRKRSHLSPALLAVTMALCLNASITNLIKLLVGRPRPDFFFRCFPDGKVPNGQPSTYDLKCTGEEGFINGGRKSFPSGHSSFSFCGLGFCTLYLAGQLKCFSIKGRGSSWRLLVSILPVIFATAIALSRTSDYRHHWQDVLVGSIMGFAITYLCYRQHYPKLSHNESDMPYMRADSGDLAHIKSIDRLQSVLVERDV